MGRRLIGVPTKEIQIQKLKFVSIIIERKFIFISYKFVMNVARKKFE